VRRNLCLLRSVFLMRGRHRCASESAIEGGSREGLSGASVAHLSSWGAVWFDRVCGLPSQAIE
jgi:hypothetical protein